MSDIKTICIPSLALNYEGNILESIGMGGELYLRKQRDWQAIARAHEQTIERMGAENAELRELVRDAWGSGHPDKSCGDCEIMDECHAEIEEARKKGRSLWNTRCLFERRIEDRMRELGIEVDE